MIAIREQPFKVFYLKPVGLTGFINGWYLSVFLVFFPQEPNDLPVVAGKAPRHFHFQVFERRIFLIPFRRINQEASDIYPINLLLQGFPCCGLSVWEPSLVRLLFLVCQPGQLAGPSEIAGCEKPLQVGKAQFAGPANFIDQRAFSRITEGFADVVD